MKVYVSIKQAGKRKEYITKKELILEKVPSSLRELITYFIQKNVQEYNDKSVEPLVTKYLSKEDVENQAKTGKVGFWGRRSEKQADAESAIKTAILAFSDGIYRVFIGEDEIASLDEALSIKDGDVLTFIRFTMLSGGMW